MQKRKQNEKQTIMILEDDEDLAEGISLSLNSADLEFVLCGTVYGLQRSENAVLPKKRWNRYRFSRPEKTAAD